MVGEGGGGGPITKESLPDQTCNLTPHAPCQLLDSRTASAGNASQIGCQGRDVTSCSSN